MKRISIFLFAVFFVLLNIQAASSFAVNKRVIEIPERGPVVTIVLSNNTHSFSFMPPPEFRSVTANTNEIVALGNVDGHVLMTVNITGNSPGSLAPEAVQRAYLNELYPKCNILKTSPAYSGLGVGRTFDVYRTVNVTPLITKHAFFAYDAGTVEIVFTIFAQEAAQQHGTINTLFSTFTVQKLSQTPVVK